MTRAINSALLSNLATKKSRSPTVVQNRVAYYRGFERVTGASGVESARLSIGFLGSIPIARSINPVDAVGFTGFLPRKVPLKTTILDAVGRGFGVPESNWTQTFGVLSTKSQRKPSSQVG